MPYGKDSFNPALDPHRDVFALPVRICLHVWASGAINVVTRRLPPKETMKMTTSIPQEQTRTAPATATTKARVAKRRPHAAPTKAKPGKATRAKIASARPGTKAARVLDLLKRPGGVSLKDIMKATDWQPHSVRGFISGTLGKKMALKVESTKTESGDRIYSVK